MALATDNRALDLAHELFEVVTQICLSTLRGRRRSGELKEIEFLTMSILQANGSMIVGDIQRILGVLPAQMSRVIRSLEHRAFPLIQCSINPHDKRKIDVLLTMEGDKVLLDYQAARVGRLADKLQHLSDDDLDDVLHVLNKIRLLLA